MKNYYGCRSGRPKTLQGYDNFRGYIEEARGIVRQLIKEAKEDSVFLPISEDIYDDAMDETTFRSCMQGTDFVQLCKNAQVLILDPEFIEAFHGKYTCNLNGLSPSSVDIFARTLALSKIDIKGEIDKACQEYITLTCRSRK